jgi:hypothetical protein
VLREEYEWPTWAFWAALALMLGIVAIRLAVRVRRPDLPSTGNTDGPHRVGCSSQRQIDVWPPSRGDRTTPRPLGGAESCRSRARLVSSVGRGYRTRCRSTSGASSVRTVGCVSLRRPLDEVVAAYVAAVGCRDEELRRALIEAAVSEAFVFCSSVGEAHGRDGFFDAIDAVQARVPPGSVLARSTAIEEHHGRARFGWRFEDPGTGTSFDEQPFGAYLRGMDFATLADDGRLASLTVFVDAGLAEAPQSQ